MKRSRKSLAVAVRFARAGAVGRPYLEGIKSQLANGHWPRRARRAAIRRINWPTNNLAAEWRRRVRDGDLEALLEEERR